MHDARRSKPCPLCQSYRRPRNADPPVMNLTHVVHEFSFGPFFPAISQPLDMSLELTEQRESCLSKPFR
jgi:hypothetical protein